VKISLEHLIRFLFKVPLFLIFISQVDSYMLVKSLNKRNKSPSILLKYIKQEALNHMHQLKQTSYVNKCFKLETIYFLCVMAKLMFIKYKNSNLKMEKKIKEMNNSKELDSSNAKALLIQYSNINITTYSLDKSGDRSNSLT
jgi:hypothetical protein